MRIHNDAAVIPVNVVIGADIGLPVRFHFRHQALLVVLRIQPHNLVDSQAVSVPEEAVLGWPEQLPAEFEDAASGPRAPESSPLVEKIGARHSAFVWALFSTCWVAYEFADGGLMSGFWSG